MKHKYYAIIVAFLFFLSCHFTAAFCQNEKGSDESYKPFQQVTKDTVKSEGLFNTYKTKDGKLYLEIQPSQLDTPYLFTVDLSRGIGQLGILTGTPIDDYIIEFHRVDDDIQVVKINPYFKAIQNTPLSRTINTDFSDSILASLKILSIHSTSGSFLIDAGDLFLSDLSDMARGINANLKGNYSFDGGKSSYKSIEAFPQNVEVESIINYASSSPPKELFYLDTVPDWRSIPIGVHYSISTIPTHNYVPRLADDRIGYFVESIKDFSSNNPDTPIIRYISRWDMTQKPIVFWIENTTPHEYREAIQNAVLEWNKAFEAIGIPNALDVKVQPDDATWSSSDVRFNVIHWISSSQSSFAALGPTRVNPMTGEIYNASVIIDGETVRRISFIYNYAIRLPQNRLHNLCELPSLKANDAATAALTVALDAADPQHFVTPTWFINAYLKDTVMHEIGHCLGLRHNFHGSTLLSLKELRNPAITKKFGLSSSIMDYVPINLSKQGEVPSEYFSSTIGPYDYWAIAYGYTPTPVHSSPEEELPELHKIASKSSHPAYAYSTDEDTYSPFAIDPHSQIFDLSSDPIAFADRRLDICHELWNKINAKLPFPGKSYDQVRRAFDMVFSSYATFSEIPTKFIGGQHFSRSHEGESIHAPFQLISKEEQLRALNVLDKQVFSENAFTFSPSFLNKLAPERHYDHFTEVQVFLTSFDYPILEKISEIQESVLDQLFRPVLLNRLLENEKRVAYPNETFTLPDHFDWMTSHFWQELNSTRNIADTRRQLQRAHVRHLIEILLEPRPQMFALPEAEIGPAPLATVPEDAQSLALTHLKKIQDKIRHALQIRSNRMNELTLSHLQSTLKLIDDALNAKLHRMLGGSARSLGPEQ